MSITCAGVAQIDPVRVKHAILGIAFALVWCTVPAYAQSLGAPSERTGHPLLASNSDVTFSATDIGEVTVTARRRTENAQDVPIPITNITDGRKLDGSDRSGFRGQLLFQPTDNFSLRAIADYKVSF